ncbi:MAG: DUF255 domain-containing protein [Armatimonadetes bacterium]|nr:DUF255 domain-containing protein [Armatimonadota bacterium]MDW8121614.1 DUF255 domain-containing protein [Armatimonadota bacterium]
MIGNKYFLPIVVILCIAGWSLWIFHRQGGKKVIEPIEPTANRLAYETSPYLLQHKDNPIHWLPWGDEAFEIAKKLDRPIFLSIGYSTCHWCHVMERESFENEEIAAILNKNFIAIKVDREERPEVDEAYMKAVLLFTGGHGGWPMSLFLTPDGLPFFGGTYFPPDAFRRILLEVSRLWKEERQRVMEAARSAAEAAAAELSFVAEDPKALDEKTLRMAEEALLRATDKVNGGFGRAPKFPPHPTLEFLLNRYEKTQRLPLWEVIHLTLTKMALGGIYDHIGGGFHRYSVDEKWLVPHFEKMLYDNAQLAALYSRAYYLAGDELFLQVARETFEFVLREMTSPDGAFYSALDAESPVTEGGHKEEGAFYLWTPEQVLSLLGPEEGRLFCKIYGITEEANFVNPHTGYRGSIPNLLQGPLTTQARLVGLSEQQLKEKVVRWKETLRSARERRPRPFRDEKILISWNGLMISAFAQGYHFLREKQYCEAAVQAAEFLWKAAGGAQGSLVHTIQEGKPKIPAFLDDYAFLAAAFLDLYQATKDPVWVERAEKLAEKMMEELWDDKAGGFWFSQRRADLFAVSKPSVDGSEPSGNGKAVQVLLRLAAIKGNSAFRQKARETLETFGGLMSKVPRACPSLLTGLDLWLAHQQGPIPTLEPVRVSLVPQRLKLVEGQPASLSLILQIAPGWHIYGPKAVKNFIPTTVTLSSSETGLELVATYFPEPEVVRLPFLSEPVAVYQGRVEIGLQIRGEKEGSYIAKITCRFQPCDDKACLSPQEKTVSLPVMVVKKASPPNR